MPWKEFRVRKTDWKDDKTSTGGNWARRGAENRANNMARWLWLQCPSGHSAASYLTSGQEGILKDSLTGRKSPAGISNWFSFGFVPQPWESNFLLEPYWSHQGPNGESLQRQERGWEAGRRKQNKRNVTAVGTQDTIWKYSNQPTTKEKLKNLCAVLSRSVVSNSLRPHGLWPAWLLCPWGFPKQKQLPCPSPRDLPNPGIEPRSPAL